MTKTNWGETYLTRCHSDPACLLHAFVTLKSTTTDAITPLRTAIHNSFHVICWVTVMATPQETETEQKFYIKVRHIKPNCPEGGQARFMTFHQLVHDKKCPFIWVFRGQRLELGCPNYGLWGNCGSFLHVALSAKRLDTPGFVHIMFLSPVLFLSVMNCDDGSLYE